MRDIITGGVYAVDLHGTESYEFKGTHPAIVVRMLKEEKMYYVVPLTTYTKERWDKCKVKGFGTRIISTNSIARVDKMNIVSEKQVQGRYFNNGNLVIPKEEEVVKVLLRVEEYIALSDLKANKEYGRFIMQRNDFSEEMEQLLKKLEFEKFKYKFRVDSNIYFEYPCSEFSFMNNSDIKDIISRYVPVDNLIIQKNERMMDITIILSNFIK